MKSKSSISCFHNFLFPSFSSIVIVLRMCVQCNLMFCFFFFFGFLLHFVLLLLLLYAHHKNAFKTNKNRNDNYRIEMNLHPNLRVLEFMQAASMCEIFRFILRFFFSRIFFSLRLFVYFVCNVDKHYKCTFWYSFKENEQKKKKKNM